MLEILDSLIATIAVIMILSLIVQGIEQILKQVFSIKSRYMERELYALFQRHILPEAIPTIGQRIKDSVTPVVWKIRALKKESGATRDAMQYFKEFFASVGYDDLSLIEKMSAKDFGALVDKLINAVGAEIASTEEKKETPAGKLVRGVHGELQNLRKNIESWFDLTLHGFQDHYERRMKMWCYAFSALVVIALNANVIAIYKEFSTNKILRAAAVAAAEEMVSRDRGTVVVPADSSQGTTARNPDSLAIPNIRRQWRQIDSLVSEQSFPIIRWNSPDGDRLRWRDSSGVHIRRAARDFWSGFRHNWLGWLGMILLVGLGAPFWYDLLRVVVGLKSNVAGGGKGGSPKEG